jgi:hypothetical protein
MKHLLNNLTEQEKNSIREQHSGGMKVVTENFSKLTNTKSGDVKTLVEQNSNNTNKSNIDKMIENEGYKKVTKVSLPDGTYIYEGSADICYISDQDGETQTGYAVEMPYSIRGLWKPEKIQVKNGAFVEGDFKSIIFKNVGYKPTQQGQGGQQNVKTVINKVATEGIKNILPEMVSAPQFKGTYSGYVFGGVFNGVNYQWDCNGVEDMSGIRGQIDGEIVTETVELMSKSIKRDLVESKPGTLCVGFYTPSQSRFILYTTNKGTPTVQTF